MNKFLELKTLKVLYVEDEPAIREFTNNLFVMLFEEVVIAKDGKDGVEKFSEAKDKKAFDMVVSDINMPNLNGIEMAKEIRGLDSHVPIVFLTAFSDTSYLLEAIELGIQDYILKPTKNIETMYNRLYRAYLPIKQRDEIEAQNEQLIKLNEKIKEVAKEEIKKAREECDIFQSDDLDLDFLLDNIELDD